MGIDFATFLVLGVIGLLALRSVIHIVPEYQRLVVFRLGAFEKVAGPGVVLLLPPPIQTVAHTADLREFVVEMPDQTCATKDNIPVSINLLVYQKVVDAADSFLKVQNFRDALVALAAKHLRSAVGETPSELLLAERDQIADELRGTLNETSRRWGVQVTTVELKDITMQSGVKGAA